MCTTMYMCFVSENPGENGISTGNCWRLAGPVQSNGHLVPYTQ